MDMIKAFFQTHALTMFWIGSAMFWVEVLRLRWDQINNQALLETTAKKVIEMKKGSV
jgi:hypothetical protein